MVFVVVMIVGLSYFAAALGPPTSDAEEALQSWAAAPEAIRWFGWAITLPGVLLVPFSLALYFALRGRERTYSLLGLVFLLFLALEILIQSSSDPTLDWEMGQIYAAGNPAEKAAVLVVAKTVGLWVEATLNVILQLLMALGAGLFGLAMAQGHAFPRWLGWLGIIGGVLGVIGLFGFFTPALTVVFMLSWLLIFAWMFLAGVYLLRQQPATE